MSRWANRPDRIRRIRKRILHRDHNTCQIQGPHCTHTATEVDHIIPRALGGGHDPENLRAVCETCHWEKTKMEAAEGRRAKLALAKHPTEPHPGIKPTPPA